MNDKLQRHWEYLENAKAYYDALLKVFSDEQLKFRPEGNQWSMLDVMQHLYTSERLSLSFMQKFDFNRKNQKLGLKATIKNILLVNRLNSKKKYKAPTVLKNNQSKLGIADDPHEFGHQWEELRKEMFDFIEQFPEEKLGYFVFSHPAVGKQSLKHALQFFVAHMKHHQYQIERINHHDDFPK